jgi:hypothetical protein
MREAAAVFSRACIFAALIAVCPPAHSQSAARLWGGAYYQAVGDDAAGSDPTLWGIAQETGLSLNVQAAGGLELLADFTLPFSPDEDLAPEAVVLQLFVRFSPFDGATVSAGRQRLNWGTAKIFSAIDTLEVRANPLDLRVVLPGVTGLKVELMPSDRIGISLVALPTTNIRWSRAAVRLDLVEETLGLDLGLGAVKYTFLDRTVPGADPQPLDDLALMSDGAWSSGPLVLYEEMQLRWGRETGYSFPGMSGFDDLGGRGEAVFRGVGGIMLQAGLGLARPATILVEYLYNGDGFNPDEARQFESRYAAWQTAGSPSGAQMPAVLTILGGFRRHYLSAALQDVALDKTVFLGVTGVMGIDSLLARLGISLEWKPSQETSVMMGYELFHAFLLAADQPTELLLVPFCSRVTLAISTSF